MVKTIVWVVKKNKELYLQFCSYLLLPRSRGIEDEIRLLFVLMFRLSFCPRFSTFFYQIYLALLFLIRLLNAIDYFFSTNRKKRIFIWKLVINWDEKAGWWCEEFVDTDFCVFSAVFDLTTSSSNRFAIHLSHNITLLGYTVVYSMLLHFNQCYHNRCLSPSAWFRLYNPKYRLHYYVFSCIALVKMQTMRKKIRKAHARFNGICIVSCTFYAFI